MKRLLIVYPEGDSPHAIRIVRPLARYLPSHGWQPTLMTAPGQGRHLPLERVEVSAGGFSLNARVPELDAQSRSSKRLRTAMRSFVGRHLAVPDRYNWWAVQAIRASRQLPRYDAVLTSGPPHSAHLVGADFRRLHAVPWVADMRDPWSTNHYTIYSKITRLVDRQIELHSLRQATAIVTVSDQLASSVSALHHRPVETIVNSFDRAEFADFSPPSFDPLAICYAGSLIGGRRRPELLLRAMALLRKKRPQLRIHALFMTDEPKLVKEAAIRAEVADIVDNQGWAHRDEVLAAWQRASVLVLLRWDDPRDEGVPTGKLFEYLGAGRPVLSLGGAAGVVGQILEESGAGEHCHSAEQAAVFLQRVADHAAPPPVNISAYSAETMASRFADVLEHG